MSDGFQVIMSEVLSASEVFGTGSRILADAVSHGGPRPVDGGGAVINAALSDALRAASLTTGQLAAVIDTHSQKLHTAYDRYRGTEETNRQLCQQLISMARLSGRA
jgi:Family of unknown function (DUF6317)